MAVDLNRNINILKRFSAQADKLADVKFNCLHEYKVSLKSKGYGPLKNHSEFPNEDILAVFLMNLRFFIIQNKNDYNFEKICEYFIENSFKEKEVLAWLGAYNESTTAEGFKITANGKVLTRSAIFHTILNEEFFHQETGQKGVDIFNKNELLEPIVRMKFFQTIHQLRAVICSFNTQIVKPYLKNYEK